jgi:tRNA threonylcarbamoyladenosine biosynthesis protein TsaE
MNKKESVITVKNEQETEKLAFELGKELVGGELITLDGDLGTGKTFFTGALCTALAIERRNISSPTYVIMRKIEGALTVYHWDFYRINHEDELFTADFFECLHEKNAVNIVEWASLFRKSWENYEPRIEINLEFGDTDDERRIKTKRIGTR